MDRKGLNCARLYIATTEAAKLFGDRVLEPCSNNTMLTLDSEQKALTSNLYIKINKILFILYY